MKLLLCGLRRRIWNRNYRLIPSLLHAICLCHMPSISAACRPAPQCRPDSHTFAFLHKYITRDLEERGHKWDGFENAKRKILINIENRKRKWLRITDVDCGQKYRAQDTLIKKRKWKKIKIRCGWFLIRSDEITDPKVIKMMHGEQYVMLSHNMS